MTEHSPKVESLIEHYKELSETVSGDPAVGEQNAQIARKIIGSVWDDAIDFISRHYEDYLPLRWGAEADKANPYRAEEEA